MFWPARLQKQAGQPRKLWHSINTILESDRARKPKSKDNPTAQDLLNFFNENVDAVRRSTGGGPVHTSLPPTVENFDTLTPVTVSVPPIAVADAAPVYSRIILYEVNSLYSVTLYFCEPSFMLYMYRTNGLSRRYF